MNREDQLFFQLVTIFHSSAMVAMGKIINPASGKIDRNLEQAQESIEMLIMLRDRMKGNLGSEQQKLIDSVLTELRLNFVDEKNKDQVNS